MKTKHLPLTLLLSSLSLTQFAQAELIIQPTATTNTVIATIANQPSDASIERLVQVLHIDSQIDSIIARQQAMTQAISQLPQMPAGDKPKGWGIKKWGEKKQYEVQQVLGKYGKVLAQNNDPVAQRQQMLEAYKLSAKQHFTQAEVDAQIAFYDTPMGQQILAKQPLVTQDYLEKAVPAVMGELPNNIEKMLPDLQKDIERIFN